MNVEVSNKEVLRAIKTLKNHKSPGKDDITNEMIKYGGKKLKAEVVKLKKWFFVITDSYRMEIKCFTVNFKRGDRMDIENYRGIPMLLD